MMKKIASVTALLVLFMSITALSQVRKQPVQPAVISGAERMSLWLPLLKNKAVALFANQTSMVGNTHIADTLIGSKINLVKILGPEHGFRGTADAGEHINDGIDKKTGVAVVSLYGNHKKPTAEDLKNIDIVVFDIQDVGVRFYTFISSLQYVMEACIENNKPLIILDRPNPNGFYVDGPVLQEKFKSFVGMQPIPIVYGMTIGEYANMLLNEKWLAQNTKYPIVETDLLKDKRTFLYAQAPLPGFRLHIIRCEHYDHLTKYILPVNPSPNLRQMQSVYLYPSTCFFEGTVLSEGRGTDKPFQIFGHPTLPENLFSFTPLPNEGAKSGKCFYQKCYGWNLTGTNKEILENLHGKIHLKYLINAYKLFPGKDSFFLTNNFFNKLAGNDLLMKQIKKGVSEKDIRKSWEPALTKFKAIRKKYLLYDDFE